MTYLIVAVVAALIALMLARALGRRRRSATAKRRGRRAVDGETRAAPLLARAGYAIVARQARITWTPLLDDEPHPIELRADYLVERGGRRFVAEVKTGDVAPSLDTAATRRQLLEYLVAFGVDGVLLVCVERGAIHRVDFAQ